MRRNTLNGFKVLVTGGSAGLGRAMVEAIAQRGAEVTAIARDQRQLDEIAGESIKTIAGDATDANFMKQVVGDVSPDVCILNAGARLALGSIDSLSFDEFSVNWNQDVKAALVGVQAALQIPLRTGSRVLLMSSGAAMILGSSRIPNDSVRLSGGYVGAKYMIWLMAHHANTVSAERGLDIHFEALLPTQLMAGTALGCEVASAYSERIGTSPEAYLQSRYGLPMTPGRVGEQVADILAGTTYRNRVAHGLTREGAPLDLDI